MKKIILKFVFFLFLVLALDILVGYLSDYLIRNAKSGGTEKLEHICKRTNEDILIFGSSRGCHHYDSRIFRDSVGMSTYNCSFGGCGSILMYGLLDIITDHYSPKYIIYDIQPSFDYLIDNEDNSKYLRYLKSYYDCEGIDSIFWRIDPNERWKMMSKMYRVNGIFIQLLSENIIKRNENILGYIPLNKKMQNQPEVVYSNKVPPFDETKKYYFEKIINLCKKKSIKLIFCASPYYRKTTDKEFDYIKIISKKNNIPFLNHSCDEDFINNRNLFCDSFHMNREGASNYSKTLAKEIIYLIN